MKRLAAFIIFISLNVIVHDAALAQNKPNAAINSAKEVGKVVVFTLSSDKPFIFGSNRYLLFIGDKEFFLNKQWTEADGSGKISFYVPADDFHNLAEGEAVYLTYGDVFKNVPAGERESVSKKSSMCWSLGKLSKQALLK